MSLSDIKSVSHESTKTRSLFFEKLIQEDSGGIDAFFAKNNNTGISYSIYFGNSISFISALFAKLEKILISNKKKYLRIIAMLLGNENFLSYLRSCPYGSSQMFEIIGRTFVFVVQHGSVAEVRLFLQRPVEAYLTQQVVKKGYIQASQLKKTEITNLIQSHLKK